MAKNDDCRRGVAVHEDRETWQRKTLSVYDSSQSALGQSPGILIEHAEYHSSSALTVLQISAMRVGV